MLVFLFYMKAVFYLLCVCLIEDFHSFGLMQQLVEELGSHLFAYEHVSE